MKPVSTISFPFLVLAVAACSGASGTTTTGDPATGSDASATTVACSPTCNPQTGACGPLQVCSTANPCTDGTSPIYKPTCSTIPSTGRPLFDDGPPMKWTDTDGDTRYACVHAPTVIPGTRLPLVVFLHGSFGSADNLYNETSLRSKADPYGFVIASMQGRNLHWLGQDPDGPHHDYYYRDLQSPSANPDVRSLDYLVDQLVAGGSVDPNRIYVVGWSNGAFMAQMYGIARHVTGTTPDGHRVAAAVAYAGADPFNTPNPTLPCQLAQYPSSEVPIFLVHRSCDAVVGCNQSQATQFGLPPGDAVEVWKQTLTAPSGVGDTTVQDLIVDDKGVTVTGCAPICLASVGALNHLRWPDGVADGGGHDHEPDMLSFLWANALP